MPPIPPPDPELPEVPELLVCNTLSLSNPCSCLFNSLAFLAAFPVLSAISPELPAASSKSFAIPPPPSSYVHPKIFPSASEITFANAIIWLIAAFKAFTSGFNALMNVVPITEPKALKFSFKTRTWFAHVSAVRMKSPCAAPVLAITY